MLNPVTGYNTSSFLSPAEAVRRNDAVARVTELAQTGRLPPALYAVVATLHLDSAELMRLPPEVAAGIAAAQEQAAVPRRLGARSRAALMEHCGAAELAGEAAGLRQFEDLLEDQLLATHRSIMFSRGRAIRANEEAACERLSHGSGTITALELQRADGSASRAMYVFQTGVDLLARLRALDPDAIEEARGSLELPGRRKKVGTTPCTVSPLRPNRPQPAGSRGPRPVDREASGGSGDAVDATLPVRDLSSEARSSNEAE